MVVIQAKAWHVLVQLGLPSCTSVCAIRRASPEQLLLHQPGGRMPTYGEDLNPGYREEPRPASPEALIRVTETRSADL